MHRKCEVDSNTSGCCGCRGVDAWNLICFQAPMKKRPSDRFDYDQSLNNPRSIKK